MIVHGEGSLSSNLWIIGEAPGAQEERTGRPFVGGSGQILDGILQEVALSRSDCYVDNVIQSRPSRNNFGIYYEDKSRRHPTPGLIAEHNRIQGLISVYTPNVVVALGNEALFAITGKKGILNWRGSILDFNGVKVIPSVHPAMIMRQYSYRPVAVLDFIRIKEEMNSPEFPEPYADIFRINPTFESVMDYITKLLPTKKYITFDIETLNNHIACIGLGFSKEDAICIPFFYGDTNYWSEDEEIVIVQSLNKLFANPDVKFIAQNAQFDLTFLRDMWGTKVNLYMDTMIAFHVAYPEMKKGLDFLTSIYTNRPYYKSMRVDGGDADTLWTYNCIDCVSTYECAMKIAEDMVEFGVFDFYRNYSHPLIEPLMEMQRRGVLIDKPKRKEVKKDLLKEQEQLQGELDEIVGHPLNVNSTKQMKEYLYEELNLPKKYNKATSAVTANAQAIEELSKRYASPSFSKILGIRRIRKLISTYINAPLDKDSRIRCSYMLTGTVTGRLSSRASIYGSGTNLQNIPRDPLIRSMFISDPNYYFV